MTLYHHKSLFHRLLTLQIMQQVRLWCIKATQRKCSITFSQRSINTTNTIIPYDAVTASYLDLCSKIYQSR